MAQFLLIEEELINIDHIVRIFNVDSQGHTKLELVGGHVFESYGWSVEGIQDMLLLAGAKVDTIAEERVWKNQKNKRKA